jgi:hypothetical protein
MTQFFLSTIEPFRTWHEIIEPFLLFLNKRHLTQANLTRDREVNFWMPHGFISLTSIPCLNPRIKAV